jgi:phospholipase/carboxylesterase
MPRQTTAARPPQSKTNVTAGRRDPICPLPLTQALADYFARQGARVDMRLREGGRELRQQEIDAIAAFFGRTG